MTSAYLLDTNAVVARLNGDNEIIRFIEENADEILFTSIVLGELYYGAEKSQRVEENIQKIDNLIRGRIVLNNDTQTARLYGRIHQQLRAKGRPIPQNDIWIAATAIQHDLILLTRDQHFNEIDALSTQNWQ